MKKDPRPREQGKKKKKKEERKEDWSSFPYNGTKVHWVHGTREKTFKR